jgi:diaminohydroxyphosphoribosylaminopyrimidine deaminase/5-amino-6-(5-phosphoribosylamino)uracil reductase
MKNAPPGGRAIAKLILLLLLLQSCSSKPVNAGVHHEQIRGILKKIHTWQDEPWQHRPFVTLSYAQSLDGKIAHYRNDNATISTLSSNLPLSGEASLCMTHALRSVHDAILVGSKTLLVDNPRLSNRLWGKKQPRPVLLDADLKCIKELGSDRRVQRAIVCCSFKASKSLDSPEDLTLLGCKVDEHGRLDLHDVLQQLSFSFGIRSIMVEGGSGILSAFATKGLVDCVCITIAPKLLGQDQSLAAMQSVPQLVSLVDGSFLPLGEDCIFLAKWPL